jgi:CPA2 family monovalent cation:H+ antiporter-2
MHMPHLLTDVVVILGLSVPIILLFQRLRLPAILGFLLTGIVVGPAGLNLIASRHEVEMLSEIGIVFLLFIIGVEFSLKGLVSIRRTVLGGGTAQVGGTIALTALAATAAGMEAGPAVFAGFLVALSSTAIVLRLYSESGELAAPHGRVAVGILIFQDIAVVLLLLLTPLVAGRSAEPLRALGDLALRLGATVAGVALVGRYAVPVIYRAVHRARSKELFLVTTLVLCFAFSWGTASLGLSLALGAFFAGLVISESPYAHQATAGVLPFRELFISFFFVSVGMLLDLDFVWHNVPLVLGVTLAVALLKGGVVALTVRALGYAGRTALQTAFALFQVGEFSFLLAAAGRENGLVGDEVYQLFLAVSICTMVATPFAMRLAPRAAQGGLGRLAGAADDLSVPGLGAARPEGGPSAEGQGFHALRDHLVILGYGLNGENVARAARHADIPHVVVDLDPDAHRRARRRGEPFLAGDASDPEILREAGVHHARAVVVAISSPQATRAIVRHVRDLSRTAWLIVRTRQVAEIDALQAAGADVVIPEEFETSIEIFARVLRHYLVPTAEVEAFVRHVREGNYDMLRQLDLPAGGGRIPIPDAEIAVLPVQQGDNKVVGRSLADSGLRAEYGVTVLAIRRDGAFLTELGPSTVVRQDDTLYVFGHPDAVSRLNGVLKLG